MKTFAEWSPKFNKANGLMASEAQAEFLFNLGKITRVGIEVGTFKGYSLSIIAAGMLSVKSGLAERTLYSIDTFKCSHMTLPEEDTLPIAKKAIKDVGAEHLVKWIAEDNRTAWQRLPPTLQADWLFIDADHAYEPTLQNCIDYSPFVKRGGLVMFHDNDTKCFPEVVKAIRSAERLRIIEKLCEWDDFYVGINQ